MDKHNYTPTTEEIQEIKKIYEKKEKKFWRNLKKEKSLNENAK